MQCNSAKNYFILVEMLLQQLNAHKFSNIRYKTYIVSHCQSQALLRVEFYASPTTS